MKIYAATLFAASQFTGEFSMTTYVCLAKNDEDAYKFALAECTRRYPHHTKHMVTSYVAIPESLIEARKGG